MTRHLLNAARYLLSLDSQAEHVARAHQWLCHPDGTECDGGLTCLADPARLAAYGRAADERDAVYLHQVDEDCEVDPGTGLCRTCGVHHGDPCPGCGARAYHRPGILRAE